MGVGAEEDMLEKNNSNEKNDKVTFEWCGCSWDLVETLNFRDENRKEEVLKAWQEQVAFIFDTCMLCTLSTCARSDSDMYDRGAGKTAESQDGNESCSHAFFDNYPETSLMFYAWCKEENAIVFTTPSKNDLKYKNIMKNQHVSILLHNYCGNSATKAMLHSMPGEFIDATEEKASMSRNVCNLCGVYIVCFVRLLTSCVAFIIILV